MEHTELFPKLENLLLQFQNTVHLATHTGKSKMFSLSRNKQINPFPLNKFERVTSDGKSDNVGDPRS